RPPRRGTWRSTRCSNGDSPAHADVVEAKRTDATSIDRRLLVGLARPAEICEEERAARQAATPKARVQERHELPRGMQAVPLRPGTQVGRPVVSGRAPLVPPAVEPAGVVGGTQPLE